MEAALELRLEKAALACRGLACLTAAVAILFPYL